MFKFQSIRAKRVNLCEALGGVQFTKKAKSVFEEEVHFMISMYLDLKNYLFDLLFFYTKQVKKTKILSIH